MDDSTRKRLIARTISGVLLFRPEHGFPEGSGPFLVGTPTRLQRAIAEEVYAEAYDEGVLDGLYTEDNLLLFLGEAGLWAPTDDNSLARLVKDTENCKVALFQNYYREDAKKVARRTLALARSEYSNLLTRRHSYDHQSATGHASLSKTRYLTAVSLYKRDGSPVFPDDCCWESQSTLIEEALSFVLTNQLDDGAIRELARTDPWQTIWRARKGENSLFGTPAVDYTEDQKSLIGWAITFDNIADHPEAPAQDIVEDDDALDGWLIVQKRKREADNLTKRADALVEANPHLKGAGEIFVVARSVKDVEDIDALNDPEAAARKKMRLGHIQKVGAVDEANLPDVRNELRMQAVRMESQLVKGK